MVLLGGNNNGGHCPHCLGGPELCREAEDAFCLVCGYRLSYYGKPLTEGELDVLYNSGREIAFELSMAYPLHQPGARHHGLSAPAGMSAGG